MSDRSKDKILAPVIAVILIVVLLGSILMLVYGATTPDTPGPQATQRNALLAIGSILLILSSVAIAMYIYYATQHFNIGDLMNNYGVEPNYNSYGNL